MTFKTKMMLAAAAAASALAAGAPAFAQDHAGHYGAGFSYGQARTYETGYSYGDQGRGLFDHATRLQGWIDNGREQGWLRPDQAYRLSADLRDVRRQAWQARRDGIDGRESAWIDAQLDRIGDRLRMIREHGGGDGRRW